MVVKSLLGFLSIDLGRFQPLYIRTQEYTLQSKTLRSLRKNIYIFPLLNIFDSCEFTCEELCLAS